MLSLRRLTNFNNLRADLILMKKTNLLSKLFHNCAGKYLTSSKFVFRKTLILVSLLHSHTLITWTGQIQFLRNTYNWKTLRLPTKHQHFSANLWICLLWSCKCKLLAERTQFKTSEYYMIQKQLKLTEKLTAWWRISISKILYQSNLKKGSMMPMN